MRKDAAITNVPSEQNTPAMNELNGSRLKRIPYTAYITKVAKLSKIKLSKSCSFNGVSLKYLDLAILKAEITVGPTF